MEQPRNMFKKIKTFNRHITGPDIRYDVHTVYYKVHLYTVKSFLFVGHLILWAGQSTKKDSNEIHMHFSNIAYNSKSTNFSVQEHVQSPQTI